MVLKKIYNFDPYSVILAIATNIPQQLTTAFVVQGHKYQSSLYLSQAKTKSRSQTFSYLGFLVLIMDQWIYPSSQENPRVSWKFMRKYNFLIRFVNDNKLCQNKGLVHFTKQKNTYSSGRKPNLFKWNVSNIPWLYISLLQCLNANLKKMQIINYNNHSINVILENNLLFVSIKILNIVGFLRVFTTGEEPKDLLIDACEKAQETQRNVQSSFLIPCIWM